MWKEAPGVFNPPKPKTEEKPSKPTMKPSPAAKKGDANKSGGSGNNKTFQKAFDGIKDGKKGDQNKRTGKKSQNSSSSYVKTNQEGKKIIDLHGKGSLKVDEEPVQQTSRQERGKGNILDRIQRRDKTKDKSKFCPFEPVSTCSANSMLDMDLDSVIKKQKQDHRKGNDWTQGPRKRGHFEQPSEGQFEEDETHGKPKYNKYHNPYTGPKGFKRQKQGEEGEGEGDAETKGYKGKKGGYYDPMMGYGGYPGMYGAYPGMYMDPYMIYGGYGYKPFKKTFKNKTLIVKKDDKEKKEEPAGDPSTN